MTGDDLHELLVTTYGLVPEPVAHGVSRTYFLREVQWHPQRSTRVVRILWGAGGEPARMQLCASSDNNNAVLIAAPFSAGSLAGPLAREVALVEARLCAADAARVEP